MLLAFGLFNYLGGSPATENTFGTPVYPVTALMMEYMQGSYQFLLVIIVAFYAGDVLWRERDAKLAEVTDSLPVPNWVPLLSKLGAVSAVVFTFIGFGVLAAIGYQLWHGYTNIELLVYLQAAFIDAWPFALMGALALVLQVISNQKFIGYLLLILNDRADYAEPDRLRAQLVPLRRFAGHEIFGHERLRSSVAAVGMVQFLLDHLRGDADRARECVLGSRYGVALEPSLARGDAELARSAGRGSCQPGIGVHRHGRLDLLQHQRSQRTSARNTCARDRQARVEKEYRKTYKHLLPSRGPKIVAVNLTVESIPTSDGAHARRTIVMTTENGVPVRRAAPELRGGPSPRGSRRLRLGGRARRRRPRPWRANPYELATNRSRRVRAPTLAFDPRELPTHGFTNMEAAVDSAPWSTIGASVPTARAGQLPSAHFGYNEPGRGLERDQDRRKFGLAPKERSARPRRPEGPWQRPSGTRRRLRSTFEPR